MKVRLLWTYWRQRFEFLEVHVLDLREESAEQPELTSLFHSANAST